MKRIYSRLLSLILIFNLLIGTPGLVLAQDASPTAENTQTGESSTNDSGNTTNQTTDVTNNNDSTTTNDTTATTDSGNNTAVENTGNGSIETQDSTTGVDTSTTTNTNTTTPQPSYSPMPWTTWTGAGDWQTRAENNQTGSNSTNTANNNTDNNTSLTNNNNAVIGNTTNAGSNTGTNEASKNTGDANIQTGNASTVTNTKNIANTNVWTGSGDWTNFWQGEALNGYTGEDSVNEVNNNVNAIIDVLNQNGVDVNNLIASFATSGNNIANGNTGNATIQTGDASTLANLFNLANTNIFGTGAVNILYQDIYSGYSGDVNLGAASAYSLLDLLGNPLTISSNDHTGNDSSNQANNNGNFEFNLLNDNDGTLVNDLDLLAFTGGNDASGNTGDAYIQTGNSSVIATLFNMLNSNIFTNNFYLGMINIWGDWAGNLILPEYTGGNSAAQLASLSSNASNSFTGSNSDNNANNDLNNNTTITNTNDGTVDDNYNLILDTGSNSTSGNTGDGFIQSGNVYGEANNASWINQNIMTNNPWWIILVNNLGTWTPMLVSPTLADGTQLILDLDDLGLGGTNGNAEISAAGETQATNNQTGTDSANNSNNNFNSTTNLTNDNDGSIVNNISAASITGNNTADGNTGYATIETGNAEIYINVLNFLNSNIFTPSFMVAVVNVFGNWTGDILGFGQSSPQIAQTPPQTNSPQPQGGTNDPPITTNNSNTPPTSTNTSPVNPPTILAAAIGSVAQTFSGGNWTTSNTPQEDEEEAQVLSFQEENSSPQTGSENEQLVAAINARNMAVAFAILVVLISLSFWQRARILTLLKNKLYFF